MRTHRDLTGMVFGDLEVIRFHSMRDGRNRMWACRCACGSESVVYGSNLLCGRSTSCPNCWRLKAKSGADHGQCVNRVCTKIYRAWRKMKERCSMYNPVDYKDYYNKGITVCDEWSNSFKAFRDHIGEPPSKFHSVDRIDTLRGYEPGNVRWATNLTQANNKTNNIRVEFNGENKTLSEWSRVIGVSYGTLQQRLYSGWTTERMLCEPVGSK